MPTETDNPEVNYDNIDQMIEEEVEESAAGEEEEETPSDDPNAGEEEEETPDDEEDPRIPEKFKGKSAAEIAEAYTNLESHLNNKALELAQSMMGNNKGSDKDAKKASEEMGDDDFGLTEEEMKKMTPKQFMQHMNKMVTERARKIVTQTMSQQNEVRSTVRSEIKQVTKDHPHLKTNKDYRSLVVDTIDAAASRGEKLSLAEACKRADRALGYKPGAKPAADPAKPKKKPRTAVEKTDGPSGGDSKTEEDRVKEGLLGAQSTQGLGGLGV